MQTQRENTQQCKLDDLDEAAVILLGLTSSELGMVFGSSILCYVIIGAIAFGLMGLPVGIGVGLIQGWFLGEKIGRMKQGRPSYLLIGELTRKWQLDGLSVFGLFKIKIPSGFIDDTTWDTQSHIHGTRLDLIKRKSNEEQ
ncbi:DUF3487 family protein [Photobacterium leiognathi]|uniref:DUF3487 family protein n=1 Tax=Photobacterium leiognathi TaxID=553611 RepID=UPI002981141C|nr:DUF3487 family protein [Photobacterium leiognathi]